ncbi:MAG: hypothetical protein AAGA97_09870, partial [Pseudomonadota bacterium]
SELWARSGGEALFDAVERQVKLGRSEELDRARMLLRQVPASDLLPDSQTGSKAQFAEPPKAPVHKSSASKAPKHRLQKALSDLTKNAEQMFEQNADLGPSGYADILQNCIDALRNMSQTLGVSAADPSIADIIQDTQEGEDMLLLLQLEHSEASATDALALMVQLKKEVALEAKT